MPKVVCTQLNNEFEFSLGENLMHGLLKRGVPVVSSCSGEGICAKCRMSVIALGGALLPAQESEQFVVSKEGFAKDERLSCQVTVDVSMQVATRYW